MARLSANKNMLLIKTPKNTMSAFFNMAQSVLNTILKTIISNENSRLDMDFSAPA